MVEATPGGAPWNVRALGPYGTIEADTPEEKGGRGDGWRPHDLLEASVATCLTISIRMAAARLGLEAESVEVRAWIDRPDPDAPVLRYAARVPGLDPASEEQLLAEVESFPVQQTLSRLALAPRERWE